MNINISQIKDYPIYHCKFQKQYLLAMTFIRFQEHYESPRDYFRNNPFTLEEYMDWYADRFRFFTYDQDWNGFNVPSNIIKDVQSSFVPLRDKEQELLTKLSGAGILSQDRFYIIGTCKTEAVENLKHETAHGLFFCDEEYKNKVTKIVSRFEVAALRKKLLSFGYWEGVMVDEIQAYALTGYPMRPDAEMKRLKSRLKEAVGSYFNNLSLKQITS